MALLARLTLEAGIPRGRHQLRHRIRRGGRARALVTHPGVDKISFTGSSETGKLIARGATDTLKRVSLELGGKSPNIVFADADPAAAIAGACMGDLRLPGRELHRRLAPLRAARRLFDEVVARHRRPGALAAARPGLDASTEMGPLVSQEQLDRVLGYIDIGRAEGVEIVTGGGRWGEPATSSSRR